MTQPEDWRQINRANWDERVPIHLGAASYDLSALRAGRGRLQPIEESELRPVKLTNTLAFMFETRFPQHLTKFAAELETLQEDYAECWTPLAKKFTGARYSCRGY